MAASYRKFGIADFRSCVVSNRRMRRGQRGEKTMMKRETDENGLKRERTSENFHDKTTEGGGGWIGDLGFTNDCVTEGPYSQL